MNQIDVHNEIDKIIEETDMFEETFMCDVCKDTGEIEIMGDGDNFENDVVGIRKCDCQQD